MSLAFQHAFSRMVLLLFSFGMQDYGFWRFWNNTESNSTSEGRGEAKQNNCEGQTVPLAIQHVFLGSGFIVFLSFGMRNFVPRLSPKNILQKFTYWYTMLYTTQISFAWANKHSASWRLEHNIGCGIIWRHLRMLAVKHFPDWMQWQRMLSDICNLLRNTIFIQLM